MTTSTHRFGSRRAAATFLTFFFVAVAVGCQGPVREPLPSSPLPLPSEPAVTVRLSRYAGKTSLPISIDGPYAIYDGSGSTLLDEGDRLERDTLRIVGDGFELGAKRFAVGSLVLRPSRLETTEIRLDGRPYLGDLEIRADSTGSLVFENRAPLEVYLEGVVPSEMPANYPQAALRAQAIAARSYAVAQLTLAAERGRAAILDDSVASMAYRGREWVRPSTNEAVRATRGQILTWAGRPLTAYFHSTCGGTTYSARDAFDDAAPPPLAGGVADPFCRNAKYARWRAELPGELLDSTVARLGLGGAFRSIVVTQSTLGRATRVLVETDRDHREISGIDFRLACDPARLRSTSWTHVVPWRDGIVIEGRGYGHGVGLCQVGAKGMAEAGRDSTSILRHFYPRAQIVVAYGDTARAGITSP